MCFSEINMPFSSFEKQVFKNGYQVAAGIDEVGRGCLAGPVAASVVAFDSGAVPIKQKLSLFFRGSPRMLDSKQLSEKQREEIFEEIKNNSDFSWRVSFVWPKTIDKINIWRATLLAWQRCLKKLNPQPNFLFLDGKFGLPKLKIIQKPIIKGDQKIFLLSLASIMAKVSRDRLMKKIDQKYQNFNFAQHKGYGTKLHLERLKKFGPCEIHRKSFRPVFENLPFKEKVYYVVSQIPRGRIMTYQEVAQKINRPLAYRAVGNVLNKNTNPYIFCHRVIRSDGRLGGYNRGNRIKEKLLRKEGVNL